MVRFTLRLPDELHDRLKALASKSQRSLHAEILWLLTQGAEHASADNYVAELRRAIADAQCFLDRHQ
jgi:predicted transcriptional regulator